MVLCSFDFSIFKFNNKDLHFRLVAEVIGLELVTATSTPANDCLHLSQMRTDFGPILG